MGSLSQDLAVARDIAARSPESVPGFPGTNPEYARGALVAAAVAPGIAPFVAARVGLGSAFEGGLSYTGRSIRVDLRRSFEVGGLTLSAGLGGTAALYGNDPASSLPSVDLAALKGYGADLPLLVGWQSAGALYRVWGGLRGGFERDRLARLTSEPKEVPQGSTPIELEATRLYGGGLVGAATGFRHFHVALELDVAYQAVQGTFNGTKVAVSGLSMSPATAVWWTF